MRILQENNLSICEIKKSYTKSASSGSLGQATYARSVRTTGRSNGSCALQGILHSPLAEQIVARIDATSPREACEVALYFEEMFTCVAEMRRVLRHGGRACIMIGNTHLCGVEVQNAQVFAEQLSALGFVLERVVLREIPSKILPRTRDKATGKFAKTLEADYVAYPIEYIVIARLPE